MEKDITKPYILLNCDCMEGLLEFPDNHFDSLVTDPPSGLNIVERSWDNFFGRDGFIDAMTLRFRHMRRVLKPGAYGAVWCHFKTIHWTMRALENSGWDINDIMVHLYSGSINKGKNDEEGNNYRLNPNSEYWVIVRNNKGKRQDYVLKGMRTAAYRFGDWVVKKTGWHVDYNRTGRTPKETPITYTYGKKIGNVVHDGNLSAWIGEKASIFYCPKSSPSDSVENGRDLGNNHPSVKRIPIMRLLIDLTTPEGGTVLDPFMGSGSTGVACVDLQRKFVGMEIEKEYLNVANERIERRIRQRETGEYVFEPPKPIKMEDISAEEFKKLKVRDERTNLIKKSGTSAYPKMFRRELKQSQLEKYHEEYDKKKKKKATVEQPTLLNGMEV